MRAPPFVASAPSSEALRDGVPRLPEGERRIPEGMNRVCTKSVESEVHPCTLEFAERIRFTKCGICVLMKELGLYDLTPALCHLDYTMSEAGGVTDFVRQYTLASGGPYCDCGYKKKNK